MKGVNLEVFETLQTEDNDELRVRCECTESQNGKITLTVPAYGELKAVHIGLTDNEFDQLSAVVESFRAKRSAIASTFTKGTDHANTR